MGSDPGQDIGQPRLRIDIVHFGRLCRTANYAECLGMYVTHSGVLRDQLVVDCRRYSA